MESESKGPVNDAMSTTICCEKALILNAKIYFLYNYTYIQGMKISPNIPIVFIGCTNSDTK